MEQLIRPREIKNFRNKTDQQKEEAIWTKEQLCEKQRHKKLRILYLSSNYISFDHNLITAGNSPTYTIHHF